jgi:hypothetical protein
VAGERWYVYDGDRLPGMSSLLNMMPKAALIQWAANMAADFVLNNIDGITAMIANDREAARDAIRFAHRRKKKQAADAGTDVHTYVERLMIDRLAGRKSSFSVTPEERKFLTNFARFQREFDAEPVLIERTIWNPDVGYAGTFDGIYNVLIPERDDLAERGYPVGERQLWMIDTKTSASGIYAEAALQQIGYRHAPCYIDDTGKLQPMPHIDRIAALWLRDNGWALIPFEDTEDDWRQVQRLRASYEWKRTREKRIVGKAVNANPLMKQWSGKR